MLAALAGGRALPAGELARQAGVPPAAASVHLRRLTGAGLIKVRVQGRHRYHEIVDPEVATVLEVIAQIAPPAPVRSLPEQQAACALSEARTCYDHLGGRRGVELRDRLLAVGAIRGLDDRDHELTDRGQDLVERLGIDGRATGEPAGFRPVLHRLDRSPGASGRRAAHRDHQRVSRPRLAHPRPRPRPAGRRRLRRQCRKMVGDLMPDIRPLG